MIMSKKTFEVTANGKRQTANGNLMGEYKADNEAGAIDACCVDPGYDDLADSLAVTGGSADEFQSFEIDTDALLSAVEAAAGVSVFQDSYGNGVALVQGTSYSTYRELADAFEIDIDAFHV